MNDATFIILKIIVSVISILISLVLIPYIQERRKDAKNRQIFEYIDLAVRAAEQTIGAGNGDIKKETVVNIVRKFANAYDIAISEEQLDSLIEAAVFNMNREIIE